MSSYCKVCGQRFIGGRGETLCADPCAGKYKDDAIAKRAMDIRNDDDELLEIGFGGSETTPADYDKAMAKFFRLCEDSLSWQGDTMPGIRQIAATVGTYLRAASQRQATKEYERTEYIGEAA